MVYSDGVTTLEGGGENKITLDQVGKYRISLNTLDHGRNQSASCAFEVVDPCPEKTSRKGINLVIAIDNSGSNAHTDCPVHNRQQIANSNQIHCTTSTNREVAVRIIAEILADIANKGTEQSKSNITFTTFPRVFGSNP